MEEDIAYIMNEVGCGRALALELYTLGCENADFVVECCLQSESANMAKARIISEQLCQR